MSDSLQIIHWVFHKKIEAMVIDNLHSQISEQSNTHVLLYSLLLHNCNTIEKRTVETKKFITEKLFAIILPRKAKPT